METLVKLNLEKTDPNYYKASSEPTIRQFEPYHYLTVSGQCSPKDSPFATALEQLYSVAYAIKFLSKAEDMDFVVPKMEGFWWIDGGLSEQYTFIQTPEEDWNWKIIIRMPDFIEESHYSRAKASVKQKKSAIDVENVKFESIHDETCVQILHSGPYEAEEPAINKMMKFIDENQMEVIGYHHEIYLSDPRSVAPEKLRTILRYSVK
jgi:hypothetical protein